MLTTGQTLNTWITDKLLTGAGKEVLAQTAFNAVLAAVSLPMRIYTYVFVKGYWLLCLLCHHSVAGFALDNHWIRASDKARKAGSILSEVLKEKVQGERPVTMVRSLEKRMLVHHDASTDGLAGWIIFGSSSPFQGFDCARRV
jgi:hypothetical protein